MWLHTYIFVFITCIAENTAVNNSILSLLQSSMVASYLLKIKAFLKIDTETFSKRKITQSNSSVQYSSSVDGDNPVILKIVIPCCNSFSPLYRSLGNELRALEPD